MIPAFFMFLVDKFLSGYIEKPQVGKKTQIDMKKYRTRIKLGRIFYYVIGGLAVYGIIVIAAQSDEAFLDLWFTTMMVQCLGDTFIWSFAWGLFKIPLIISRKAVSEYLGPFLSGLVIDSDILYALTL